MAGQAKRATGGNKLSARLKSAGGQAAKFENSRGYKKFEEAVLKFMMLNMQGEERMRLYKKLSSLLRNRFSLMDGLERLWNIAAKDGKAPNEMSAIVISYWMKSVQNGNTFANALKGWAPPRERLMLSVGDVAKLDDALNNVIKTNEGNKKITSAMVGAMTYPMVLCMMTIGIIALIGLKMVPPMMDAAPNVIWTGTAKDLVSLSFFVTDWWWAMFAALPIAGTLYIVTLPILTGKIRVILDGIPPWSLYRIYTGIGWLLALSALVGAGMPVAKALRALRQDSSPYLRERIDKTLRHINNGENLGAALHKTGLNFPDPEMIGDLRIYAELDRFEEALGRMADEWLMESIERIQKQSSILNMLAMAMVAATIAWSVFGTFEMQDQITSGM